MIIFLLLKLFQHLDGVYDVKQTVVNASCFYSCLSSESADILFFILLSTMNVNIVTATAVEVIWMPLSSIKKGLCSTGASPVNCI